MKIIANIFFFILLVTDVFAGAENNSPPPAIVVTTPVVEKSTAQQTTIVGRLWFDKVCRLSAEVSGLVEAVCFHEGDHIEKGTVMVRLNRDFIRNEIDRVKAEITQIEIQLEKAEKELRRYKTLFKQNAASEKEYDDTLLLREDLASQKDIKRKELDLAVLKGEKSVISAPFDGIVLEKKTCPGNWIAPGYEICTFASTDDLIVKVPISEKLMLLTRKAGTADVFIAALDRKITGVIEGVNPVVDPVTNSIFLKVRMPLLQQAALNMSAAVSLPIEPNRRMTLVPRDSLVHFSGQSVVYTVKEGKAVTVPVDVISYSGGDAVVHGDGVVVGMPVVVDGNDRLMPNQPVKIINKG